jgi:hypothetical protein
MIWQHFWIYLLAPTLGMLASAQLHLAIRGSDATGCAKLLHPNSVRCIHCGYRPRGVTPMRPNTMVQSKGTTAPAVIQQSALEEVAMQRTPDLIRRSGSAAAFR